MIQYESYICHIRPGGQTSSDSASTGNGGAWADGNPYLGDFRYSCSNLTWSWLMQRTVPIGFRLIVLIMTYLHQSLVEQDTIKVSFLVPVFVPLSPYLRPKSPKHGLWSPDGNVRWVDGHFVKGVLFIPPGRECCPRVYHVTNSLGFI